MDVAAGTATTWPISMTLTPSRMSVMSLPCLETEGLVGIDDREDADHATVAARPAPRQRQEGAPLARDLVQVAADVLYARDAALAHEDLVGRLPAREVRLGVAAGELLVLVDEVRLCRAEAVVDQLGGD